MVKLTPFDFVNSINNKDYMEITDDYNQFVINKAFSHYVDTIMFANYLNQTKLNNQMHYDFLFNVIDKRKRWVKWPKKNEKEEFLQEIAEYYKVSLNKAEEILSLLNTKDKLELENFFDKGGRND